MYQQIGDKSPREMIIVDQLRASWNSLLAWLREAQAWGRARPTWKRSMMPPGTSTLTRVWGKRIKDMTAPAHLYAERDGSQSGSQ